MALRGGYKIIDLKGKPLKPQTRMVYDGIYDSIEETQKPILLSGLVIDTGEILFEMHDVYVSFGLVGSVFRCNIDLGAGSITLDVTDTDVVTIEMNA